MKCDKCGINEATNHYRSIINGEIIEVNICDMCLSGGNYSIPSNNGLAQMLSLLLNDISQKPTIKAKTCPACNTTFGDIAKKGKVGCSECYSTFKAELLPYIKRVQGSIKHIGNLPQANKDLESLKAELKSLVAEENYEQAAVIRDKIKEMEANANEKLV